MTVLRHLEDKHVAQQAADASPWLSCLILGVSADSPFGRSLETFAGGAGALTFGDASTPLSRGWRRTVGGTALRWFSERPNHSSISGPVDAPLILDLFGTMQVPAGGRLWRILGPEGRPLLGPFTALEACQRAPFVATLTLVECQPDGTDVHLAEASISSALPYRALLDRFALIAALLLRTALLRPCVAEPHLSVFSRPASRRNILWERLRVAAASAARQWRTRLVTEDWAVGQINAPVSVVLAGGLPPVRWIAGREDSYRADPFPLPGRPGDVLCERFDRKTGRGEIVRVTADGCETKLPDIDLGCHLSYPFTWCEDGRVFCVPEASAARKTVIFELDPSCAARVHTVIDTGHAIGDPTLFRHEGCYWLAYCDADLGGHETLCLMYADRLEGPWKQHRLNPVKIDIRSARPGGTPFTLEGELYRPAQDCSATYGGALVINRVLTCTPDAYEECEAAVLTPDPHGPYPDGLHTLSLAGDVLLIDGKRFVTSPRGLLLKAWGSLRARLPMLPVLAGLLAALSPAWASTSTLLPQGYLSTHGSQIVDASGIPRRIAAIGWGGGDTKDYVPDGLYAVRLEDTMRRMVEAGFNTIRLPYCDAWVTEPNARPPSTAINETLNPELRGLTALQVLDRIVADAKALHLKLIIDHHGNDCHGGEQANGLWYTKLVSVDQFEANWLTIAHRYKGNDTVIGYDLDNEVHAPANWGEGGPMDWSAEATRLGNRLQAVDPGPLIIVEGIITWHPTETMPVGSCETNLEAVRTLPIRLEAANKLVYSVHDYPPSVVDCGWNNAASPRFDLPGRWNRQWGFVQTDNIAPVWIGEAGSSLRTPADRAWAARLVAYVNGELSAQGGPRVPAGGQGLGWCWWNWSFDKRGEPSGLLAADWRGFKLDQLAVVKAMLPTGS